VPGGIACQQRFELHVALRPEDVDGVTKHVKEFVERLALRRDAVSFEHPTDVPFVLSVDVHVIKLHEISAVDGPQSTVAASAIPRTARRPSTRPTNSFKPLRTHRFTR
jgi:hypothetical protein